MKNGALDKRLAKAKTKKSVPVTIRFPREELEILDNLEKTASIRYDWLIREMLTQLIKLLERDKPRLIKPVYVFVLNYDEVVKRGLTDLMHTEPFETQPAKKRGGKKPPS